MKLCIFLFSLISLTVSFPLEKRAAMITQFFPSATGGTVNSGIMNLIQPTVSVSCKCTFKSVVEYQTIPLQGLPSPNIDPNLLGITSPKGSITVCNISIPTTSPTTSAWFGYKHIVLKHGAKYNIENGEIIWTDGAKTGTLKPGNF